MPRRLQSQRWWSRPRRAQIFQCVYCARPHVRALFFQAMQARRRARPTLGSPWQRPARQVQANRWCGRRQGRRRAYENALAKSSSAIESRRQKARASRPIHQAALRFALLKAVLYSVGALRNNSSFHVPNLAKRSNFLLAFFPLLCNLFRCMRVLFGVLYCHIASFIFL